MQRNDDFCFFFIVYFSLATITLKQYSVGKNIMLKKILTLEVKTYA